MIPKRLNLWKIRMVSILTIQLFCNQPYRAARRRTRCVSYDGNLLPDRFLHLSIVRDHAKKIQMVIKKSMYRSVDRLINLFGIADTNDIIDND